jgi:hypothetical protein
MEKTMTESDTFDPASHEELAHSHRLPEMRALFHAIAAGKPRRELWGQLNKLTQKLSAAEREALVALFMKAIK